MNAVPRKVIDALHARPDDDSPLVAFADELTQAGDVRGELAVLVAQRKLQPMTRFLLANAGKLFGAAEPFVHDGTVDELVWAPGFVRHATLVGSTEVPTVEVIATLLASPAGALLRSVHLSEWDELDEPDEVLAALARHQAPTLLDTVVIDGVVDDLSALWPAAPAARHLSLRGLARDVKAFPSSRLEALSWGDTWLSTTAAKALRKLPWPHLERLQLGALENEDGEVDHAGLLSFILEAKAPQLAHLCLVDWTLDEDTLAAVLESERCAKLETLDLGSCFIDAEAMSVLFDLEPNFGDLKVCLPDELADELGDYQASVWPGLVPARTRRR